MPEEIVFELSFILSGWLFVFLFSGEELSFLEVLGASSLAGSFFSSETLGVADGAEVEAGFLQFLLSR